MFWSIGFQQSAIDELLEKPDFTLEDLLKEEDLLQELKSLNRRLLDFLTQPETVAKLVRYVVSERLVPSLGDERLKHAVVSSEVLAADAGSLLSVLLSEAPLLPSLFDVFFEDTPVDTMRATLVGKVLATLLGKAPTSVWPELSRRTDLVDRFVAQLALPQVHDLLVKILDVSDEPSIDTSEWLASNHLIEKLAVVLDPKRSTPGQQANAASLLNDIIEHYSALDTGLLQSLMDRNTVEAIFVGALPDDMSPMNASACAASLRVVTMLVQRSKSSFYEETTDVASVKEPLVAVCNQLERCVRVLTIQPTDLVGSARVELFHLLAELFGSHYQYVDERIVASGVLNSMLDVFFNKPNVNLIHNPMLHCIEDILGGESAVLRRHLFADAHLAERMAAALEANESQMSGVFGKRLGLMGHLFTMANMIAGKGDLATLCPEAAIPDTWSSLVTRAAAAHTQQQQPLGGEHPGLGHHMDDLARDFPGLSTDDDEPDASFVKAPVAEWMEPHGDHGANSSLRGAGRFKRTGSLGLDDEIDDELGEHSELSGSARVPSGAGDDSEWNPYGRDMDDWNAFNSGKVSAPAQPAPDGHSDSDSGSDGGDDDDVDDDDAFGAALARSSSKPAAAAAAGSGSNSGFGNDEWDAFGSAGATTAKSSAAPAAGAAFGFDDDPFDHPAAAAASSSSSSGSASGFSFGAFGDDDNDAAPSSAGKPSSTAAVFDPFADVAPPPAPQSPAPRVEAPAAATPEGASEGGEFNDFNFWRVSYTPPRDS